MTAPERSLKQRRDALKTANEVRVKRAALKRDIGGGRVAGEEVLADPPEYALTMTLWDLVMAMRKYGRVKTNKVLTTCRVSPSKTIGGLSDRQRAEVVRMLTNGPSEYSDDVLRRARERHHRLREAPPSGPAPIIPAPGRPRELVTHMTTLVIADMHDTACGVVVAPFRATDNEHRVNCAKCLHKMAMVKA